VEAQASGRPVIALGRGGALETVVPHPGFPGTGETARPAAATAPTGVLFPEQSVDALVEAVRFFEAHERDFDPAAIRASVERFDRPRYLAEFKSWIERNLAGVRPGG
jgi:glycosyltransferase involved in cell wall biosynthesis